MRKTVPGASSAEQAPKIDLSKMPSIVETVAPEEPFQYNPETGVSRGVEQRQAEQSTKSEKTPEETPEPKRTRRALVVVGGVVVGVVGVVAGGFGISVATRGEGGPQPNKEPAATGSETPGSAEVAETPAETVARVATEVRLTPEDISNGEAAARWYERFVNATHGLKFCNEHIPGDPTQQKELIDGSVRIFYENFPTASQVAEDNVRAAAQPAIEQCAATKFVYFNNDPTEYADANESTVSVNSSLPNTLGPKGGDIGLDVTSSSVTAAQLANNAPGETRTDSTTVTFKIDDNGQATITSVTPVG